MGWGRRATEVEMTNGRSVLNRMPSRTDAAHEDDTRSGQTDR
jgi:hypothetical protein